MYEEKNTKLKINWISLILKIVLLAIFIIILCWFLKNSYLAKLNTTDTDFQSNIYNMKNLALDYFTNDNLPEKIGNSKKVSLEDMIKEKRIIDFTNDGKTCNKNNSYIQATKINENDYSLKIELICNSKSDYIITTIKKNNDNSCKEVNENSNIIDTNNKEEAKEQSPLKNETITKVEANTQNTSKKTNITTQTTTTTKTYAITCCSYNKNCCCEIEDVTNKTIYYKHVKYSEWIEGTTTENNTESKTETIKINSTCNEETSTYFATTYINANSEKNKTYEFMVRLADLQNRNLSDYYVYNADYYNSLNDYNAYFNQRNSFVNKYGISSGYNVNLNNVNDFVNSSLSKENFTFSTKEIIHYLNDYYLKINYKYISNNQIRTYNFYNNDSYFVPIKFTIKYKDADKCATTKSINYYRKFEVLWSSNLKEEGYINTGITEYR